MQYFGFDRPSFGVKTFGFGSSEFSPLDLFAGGKQGVWYDPSDKSTLFQDVAGTVPVTKDGDPVALMRDKSGNNNHATQTVSAARPIYKTDGILHWLSPDGVDDFIESAIVPWNGSSFYQASALAITGGQINRGVFRFLRVDGNPVGTADNYFEEYSNVNCTRKALIQRYPTSVTFYNDMTIRPNLGVNHVSWTTNGVSAKTQVIPTQISVSELGVMPLASGNATLSLFRGFQGELMQGRMHGFIWVSGALTDEDRDKANAYLAKKAGITL